jgi:hypothetical protein
MTFEFDFLIVGLMQVLGFLFKGLQDLVVQLLQLHLQMVY